MKLPGALLAALLVLAACATPIKTRYYTLQGALPATVKATHRASDYRVVIGPVSVPETLDRRQLVLRVAPNRDVISDVERWSEPLKRQIPRVLAADVGQVLAAADVAADAQYDAQDADYRVWIDVLRFESAPGHSVTFEAAWSVRNRAGARLHEARSLFVLPVAAAGTDPLVDAQAQALAAFAGEIAKALRGLAPVKR